MLSFYPEISYQTLKRTAKRQHSPALLADAVHYRIDALNCLFAMIALLFAAYFPKYSVLSDHLGAIVIALLMVGIGIYAAKNNINQLLDRVPARGNFSLKKSERRPCASKGCLPQRKFGSQLYGPGRSRGNRYRSFPRRFQCRTHVSNELDPKGSAPKFKKSNGPPCAMSSCNVEPYYARGSH